MTKRALPSLAGLVLAIASGCSSESGEPKYGEPAGSGGTSTGVGGTTASGAGGASTAGSPGSSAGSTAQGGSPAGAAGNPGSSGSASSGGAPGGSGGQSSDPTGGSGGTTGEGGTGGVFTGTCTASKHVKNASGSGPNQVVVEANSDPNINEGTIFRPKDLGPGKNYPIFVWGQGGCGRDGLANEAAMAEIASHGYFVVADGTPGNSDNKPNRPLGGGGEVLLGYIDWVIAENSKPCSAYYQSIDTTKVAANGFSCGGLMAAGTAADPRMTTWGHTSSGSFSENQAFYNSIHTPVLIVTGTADSVGAHENGKRDYDNIAKRGNIPVMMFAKVGADHGGDLWAPNGGQFTKVILGWLNWWLKGDLSASGKGMLVGPDCPFCNDKSWQISSANLP